MKEKELLKKLEGIQTIESVMKAIGVSRQKAIYYMHRLRKKGYVQTKQLSDNTRVYNISFENRLKGTSFYDIINKHSPVKIVVPKVYKVYGREPSIEETLVYAVKTQSLRTILAALALFRKIEDWNELYRLAKKNRIERQVGALYDTARKVMRVKRMTRFFRRRTLPKDDYWYFIIPGLKSNDFKSIEKIWQIYIPFNIKDLEGYKR